MGREIRRALLGWQHPRDERGAFVPLFDDYGAALAEWEGEPEYWGAKPDPARYMPTWPPGAVLGWQVYENVTEGTPMSPVFATEDELVAWLTDEAPIGIGGRPIQLTEEQARAFVASRYAPSFIVTGRDGIRSGLELPPRDT